MLWATPHDGRDDGGLVRLSSVWVSLTAKISSRSSESSVFVKTVVRLPARRIVWLIFCSLITIAPFAWVSTIRAQDDSQEVLQRSDPANGAIMDAAPSTLTLWFTEAPDADNITIQLLDSTGQPEQGCSAPQIDPGDPRVVRVTVAPDVALPDGVYTIVWRAGFNGAVRSGLIPFGFGAGVTLEMVTAPRVSTRSIEDTLPSPLLNLLSAALTGLSELLLIGAFLFVPLILRPAASAIHQAGHAATSAHLRFPAIQMLRIGAAIGIIGAIVQIIALAVSLTPPGGSFGTALDQIVTTNISGQMAWLRIILLLIPGALAFLFPDRLQSRIGWISGLAGSVVAIMTVAVGGQAGTLLQPALPIVLDFTRRLAEAALFGLLVSVVIGLWRSLQLPESSAKQYQSEFTHRSRLPIGIAFFLSLWAGTYTYAVLMGDPANLLVTPFGSTVLINAGIVAVATVLLILSRRFSRLNIPLFGVGLLMILSTWAIDALPSGVNAYGRGEIVRGAVGNTRVVVAISPGVPGLNTFRAWLYHNAPDQPDRLDLQFGMASHTMGLQRIELIQQPDGTYFADGGLITMWGTWDLRLSVPVNDQQIAGQAQEIAMRYAPPYRFSDEPPRTTRELTPLAARILSGVMVLILGAGALTLFAAAYRLPTRSMVRRPALGVFMSAAVFGIGTLVSIPADPTLLGEARPNPIASDQASRERGSKHYEQNCLACHGYTGAGDGPVGVNLNPPPANLQMHIAAGHTDGELFLWISKGIPGSAMPGYEDRLSENERWDIVNYIRVFGQLVVAQSAE